MANHEIGTSFDVGRVLDRTFRAIKNNFLNFLMASVFVVGLPIALISIAPFLLETQAVVSEGPVDDDLQASSAFLITGVLVMIVSGLGGCILQGALIYGAVADFNDEKASLRECLGIGLRYIFPLLGIAILIGLGVMLGMILLIVPGIILGLGWYVAVPVLIVEKRGVTDSLSRSWELTKGFKWWIFLLFLILVVVGAVIGVILGLLSIPLSDPALGNGDGVKASLIFNALASAFAQAISAMINAIGVAAVYYEIRLVKEGVGADRIASVFD